MKETKLNEANVKLDLKTVEKISETEIASANYTVYLLNMCNWTATKFKTNTGNIVNIMPPIPKTCSTHDANLCVKQGAYLPLLTCRCDDASFSIALYLTHPKGYAGWTDFVNIAPDCGHAGEILPMDISDPA